MPNRHQLVAESAINNAHCLLDVGWGTYAPWVGMTTGVWDTGLFYVYTSRSETSRGNKPGEKDTGSGI